MKKRNKKPTLIVDTETGKKLHPLVALVKSVQTRDLAKALGHSNHSTVSIYVSRARKAPTTPVPAEWCLVVAQGLGVTPHSLRPDLYLPNWRV
jgi:DNA-binding transcriptional regulator YdaS (Cro superfamily)